MKVETAKELEVYRLAYDPAMRIFEISKRLQKYPQRKRLVGALQSQ